jgi:hypothetical protein
MCDGRVYCQVRELLMTSIAHPESPAVDPGVLRDLQAHKGHDITNGARVPDVS